MAEEATTLEEGAEVAPEEGVTEVQPEAEAQAAPNPIEDLAAKAGWAPKDQWKGDPEGWKSAEDFLLVGKESIRNVSRELRTVREQMDAMSRTSAALLQQQLEQKRSEWEARFDSAVEEGDREAARTARKQIDKLETAVPASRGPSPEGRAWVEKNSSWFGKDEEATAYATNRTVHYANQGLSPARQLAAVEREMRELFPELFPRPAKQPAAVNAPASRTATVTGSREGFHDMPKVAQDVARDMLERGAIEKLEDYTKHYFENLKRKAG